MSVWVTIGGDVNGFRFAEFAYLISLRAISGLFFDIADEAGLNRNGHGAVLADGHYC
jgi:hypothetical protein